MSSCIDPEVERLLPLVRKIARVGNGEDLPDMMNALVLTLVGGIKANYRNETWAEVIEGIHRTLRSYLHVESIDPPADKRGLH
jgi:hypothetical protein